MDCQTAAQNEQPSRESTQSIQVPYSTPSGMVVAAESRQHQLHAVVGGPARTVLCTPENLCRYLLYSVGTAAQPLP